jgi:hypothetical protein
MTKTAKSTANKSEFIRQLPNDLPAAEVVKRAKAAGLTLNAGLVYAVRSNERHKPGAGAGPKNGKSAASAVGRGLAGQEAQFINLALDLGLARAEALLASVRKRLLSF